MTAMSAPARASNAEIAHDLAEPVPSKIAATAPGASPGPSRVLIPGTWRTYENREVLRGMGLRWDPPTHAWHGQLTSHERTVLRERFGLAIRPVVALESFPEGNGREVEAGSPSECSAQPRGPSPSISTSTNPPSRAHDGSRTRAEARILLKPGIPDPDDPDSQFVGDDGRGYSWWDVTSGLPDDSREEDERQEARRLRDLRGRVKAARATLSVVEGLTGRLTRSPELAASFFARFRVTPDLVERGVANLGDPPDLMSSVGLQHERVLCPATSRPRGIPVSGLTGSGDTTALLGSPSQIRWSSRPHRRRILLIRGSAALVFFAFAIPGILIGLSFTPGYWLVIVGGLGFFITIFSLEARFPPPSEYVEFRFATDDGRANS